MILTTYRIPINYLLPTPDKSNPNRIATAILFLFIGAPMYIYDVEMYVSYIMNSVSPETCIILLGLSPFPCFRNFHDYEKTANLPNTTSHLTTVVCEMWIYFKKA